MQKEENITFYIMMFLLSLELLGVLWYLYIKAY